MEILKERISQVITKGENSHELACEKASLAGSVSQRACVFCGSRVVLYPISDALHLVHGPVGCSAYTWDIRGSLSSGPQIHRLSFSTDLKEKEVVFGGEKVLYHSLKDLIPKYKPKAVFVYSTCIVGLIGDDVGAICTKVAKEEKIDVIQVQAPGFAGTKKDGYKVACDALMRIVGTMGTNNTIPDSINIIGDFNLAGELYLLRNYYEKMGIRIISTITGDGRIDDIRQSHKAALNIVQCSGSMSSLAIQMEMKYNIPYRRVSYFGIEDMSDALYEVARFFNSRPMLDKAIELVREEVIDLLPKLKHYEEALTGKKAAIYVGGAFKAISLIKALRMIGVKTVVVGSQTGNKEDYRIMKELCDEGTILVDDTNPLELTKFVKETKADILIGGVKERPIAFKLGLGFCDHNHERKMPLAGYEGMLNFAGEIYATAMSPVFRFVRK
ncbi:MAG TPA: nitrogenase iron-molybdenum cofactor biosynthesis protein NifE [Bacteroidales bacterium]|nr:nitrogenase iron-molybdenum cofactor biosynthesis protein NifE [Bacteroidales bacterium]